MVRALTSSIKECRVESLSGWSDNRDTFRQMSISDSRHETGSCLHGNALIYLIVVIRESVIYTTNAFPLCFTNIYFSSLLTAIII